MSPSASWIIIAQNHQELLLSAGVATALCGVWATLQAARKGWTGHALLYLLLASVPFLIAAVLAEHQQEGMREPKSNSEWRGGIESTPEGEASAR